MKANQNAPGAAQDTTATTKKQCESLCLSKSFSECAAYEFNRQDNRCWIHGSVATSLSTANNIDHYTREKCIPLGL